MDKVSEAVQREAPATHNTLGKQRITCEIFQQHADAFHEGAIGDRKLLAALRGHMKGCDKCRGGE